MEQGYSIIIIIYLHYKQISFKKKKKKLKSTQKLKAGFNIFYF